MMPDSDLERLRWALDRAEKALQEWMELPDEEQDDDQYSALAEAVDYAREALSRTEG